MQEQEQEQEHRRIDNDKTATTTTTSQRQRRLPPRERRRACRSASVLGMEKGILPGDLESLHAPDAQGSATPVAESGGGQVGALTDGAGPATEKSINSGGLITPSVHNGPQVLTPEPLGNGQYDRLVSGVKPEPGSLRQPRVTHQLQTLTCVQDPAIDGPVF